MHKQFSVTFAPVANSDNGAIAIKTALWWGEAKFTGWNPSYDGEDARHLKEGEHVFEYKGRAVKKPKIEKRAKPFVFGQWYRASRRAVPTYECVGVTDKHAFFRIKGDKFSVVMTNLDGSAIHHNGYAVAQEVEEVTVGYEMVLEK